MLSNPVIVTFDYLLNFFSSVVFVIFEFLMDSADV